MRKVFRKVNAKQSKVKIHTQKNLIIRRISFKPNRPEGAIIAQIVKLLKFSYFILTKRNTCFFLFLLV